MTNPIMEPIFNQLHIAVRSLVEMIGQLTDEDLKARPIPHKRSIQELLAHIAMICKADFLIANGATRQEMDDFYRENEPATPDQMKEALLQHFHFLRQKYEAYTPEQWSERTTSYWGVAYSRYEWLLEIVGHLYHHRGQLYTMLTQQGKEPKVNLFE